MYLHRPRVSPSIASAQNRALRPALLVAILIGAVAPASAQTAPVAPTPSTPEAPTAAVSAAPAEVGAVAQAQPPQGGTQDGRNFGPNSVVTGGVTPQGAHQPEPVQPGPQPQEAVPEQATAEEASPSDQPATAQDVQMVQEDLSGVRTDLENFKFQWQRERDLHTAITTRYLKINGTVQARFGWTDQIQHGPLVHDRNTSFDVPLAVLVLTGSLYKDYEEGRNLSYTLRFGVSQQANNNSFLNLLDANIAYDALSTVNPESSRLSITVGQQLLPFGLEVPATEELKPVIRNAQFTNNPGTTGIGLGLVRREVGLIIRGELFPQVDYGYNYRVPTLSYALGLVNGNGPNGLDDNNNKSVTGRIAFTVPSDYNSWLRQLTIGGSVLYGRGNIYLPASAKPPAALAGLGDRERYGVDFYYNHWPVGITYEFVEGKDEVATGDSLANPVRRINWSQSHVGTLFYSVGEQFVGAFRAQARFDDWWPKTYQPFVRYDRYRQSSKSTDTFSDVYTAGFNLFFAETTKFQANYNLKNNSVQGKEKQNHEVLLQAQFGF